MWARVRVGNLDNNATAFIRPNCTAGEDTIARLVDTMQWAAGVNKFSMICMMVVHKFAGN